MTQEKRIAYYDILKCVIIFLVIWGHCGQQLGLGMDSLDTIDGQIRTLIDMPMFMIMCGFFAFTSFQKTVKSFLLSKWNTLLLPMLVYCVGGCLTDLFVKESCITAWGGKLLISNIIYGYWFIWTVLGCSLIMLFCRKCVSSRYRPLVVCAFWIILLFMPFWPIPHLLSHKAMFPFFVFGYMLRQYEVVPLLMRHRAWSFSLAGLLFLGVFFCFSGEDSFYYFASMSKAQYAISYLLMLLGGISGFIICLMLSMQIGKKENKLTLFLKYAGQYTLAMYMMQGLVMKILGACHLHIYSEAIYFSSALLLFFSLSLIIFFCTKSEILSKYLLGKIPSLKKS